jgi:uracil-DNA glycosylase
MTVDDLPAAFSTVPSCWRQVLFGWTSPAQQQVIDQIRFVSNMREVAPPDPFRALRFSSPEQVKVVILGQDPYPGAGVADGLAFSARVGRPPSLRRIFDVLEADQPDFKRPAVWTLDGWARQGVLLLNPTLTIEVGIIGSHMACGWQTLTQEVIRVLSRLPTPPVFMLWGKSAQTFFDTSAQAPKVLRTRHPSNDFRKQFMAQGSHFVATKQLVNWWCIAP